MGAGTEPDLLTGFALLAHLTVPAVAFMLGFGTHLPRFAPPS
ncbi:hypothetical protein ABGB18_41390 [Nonomuraea sp. B12E4]